jgi:hypothetical protein
MDRIIEKDCVEPWWKCGRDDHEWVNFFSNIQNLEVSGSLTKEQVEEFFSVREDNK